MDDLIIHSTAFYSKNVLERLKKNPEELLIMLRVGGLPRGLTALLQDRADACIRIMRQTAIDTLIVAYSIGHGIAFPGGVFLTTIETSGFVSSYLGRLAIFATIPTLSDFFNVVFHRDCSWYFLCRYPDFIILFICTMFLFSYS
ncbi:hypothetical protein C0J52_27412 [Blattella germanica]|nr:hypothetical protein C0J52_27412 [Blattella germanica]